MFPLPLPGAWPISKLVKLGKNLGFSSTPNDVSEKTLFHFFFIIFSYQLGIPIPETSSGGELKPGSLPNLTNLEIGQAPGGGGGNTVNHSCNSSKTSTAGGPGTIAKDGQESPYSSVSIYSVF